MAVYVLSFAFTCLIVAYAGRKGCQEISFKCAVAFAIAIPCIVAGLRGLGVGTDIAVYAKPLFDLAMEHVSFSDYLGSSWWRVWTYVSPSDFEIGFSTIVWLAARLTGSFNVLLFAIQLLTIYPIYKAASLMVDKEHLWIAFLIYLFMFFNSTLNLMRQWIGIAFCLWAIAEMLKSEDVRVLLKEGGARAVLGTGAFRALALVLIASLFHISALPLGLLGLLLVSLFRKSKRPSRFCLIFAVLLLVALLFIAPFSELLRSFGLSQYAAYLGNGQLSFSPRSLALYGLPLVVLAAVLHFETLSEAQGRILFSFLFLAVMAIVLTQLGSLTAQASRISFYYLAAVILWGPWCLSLVADRSRETLLTVFLAVYCIGFWVLIYVVMGATETIPYYFPETLFW